MSINDSATEPLHSILIEDTPERFTDGCADTSQTDIKPVLTVYKSASAAANAVTLTGAAFGDSVLGESTIYQPEIPASNPAFPQAYDKSTAFPAIGSPGSTFSMQEWKVGDKVWVKSGSINTVARETLLIPAASGLWAIPAGTTTIDVQNVHYVKCLRTVTGKTYHKVEYMGRAAFDNS